MQSQSRLYQHPQHRYRLDRGRHRFGAVAGHGPDPRPLLRPLEAAIGHFDSDRPRAITQRH